MTNKHDMICLKLTCCMQDHLDCHRLSKEGRIQAKLLTRAEHHHLPKHAAFEMAMGQWLLLCNASHAPMSQFESHAQISCHGDEHASVLLAKLRGKEHARRAVVV